MEEMDVKKKEEEEDEVEERKEKEKEEEEEEEEGKGEETRVCASSKNPSSSVLHKSHFLSNYHQKTAIRSLQPRHHGQHTVTPLVDLWPVIR